MAHSPRIACVIPARLASTRFPKKILYPIHGKTLLEHTWRAASTITQFSSIVVAVDSIEVANLVSSFGATPVYTDPSCKNGTHRMIAALNARPDLHADIWVNWQADTPTLSYAVIRDLLANAVATDNAHIWTLKTLITDHCEIANPHVVKVVCNRDNNALYFSRLAIPYYSPSYVGERIYYKHVGIYAFTLQALDLIAQTEDQALAEIESLEQLAFLSAGIPITVNVTKHAVQSVDTLQDIDLVKHALT